MDQISDKKKTFRQTTSIDEHLELVDKHTPVKPDVCPDVQPSDFSNIQEPDIVRSSSSSSGNCSRVSSFASNSLEEENLTTTPEVIREKRKLFKEKKIGNLSQESADDVFELMEISPAPSYATEKNRFFSDSSMLSEKGKQKRSQFSSSGYGTGSGGSAQGNSVSKISTDSSQNSDETVVAAPPVVTNVKTVQIIAIENDFKPKCSPRMAIMTAIPVGPPQPNENAAAQENDIARRESLLSVDLCRDDSSKVFGNSKVFSCSELSAAEKSFSTTNGSVFEGVNVGSIGPFPLSSSSAQVVSSSSGSGSFYINSSDESKFHAPNTLPDSLLKEMCASSVPGNSVMSNESKYLLDDLLNGIYPECGTKHQANLSSLSFQTSESHFPTSALFVDNELATMLEKSGRCEEEICDDYQCQKIKSRIKELSNGGLKAADLNEEQKSLLYHMCGHVKDCTLPKCPFSWCEPSSIEENFPEEEQLFLMKRKLENFTDDKMLHGNMLEFLKIYPKLPYEDLPMEHMHWSRLCMLENSSRAVLAAHNQGESQEYWVIKKNLVDDDYFWKVCTQLRKLSSACVVQMLWAAKFEGHVLICSKFEGYHSLQDSLKASAHCGLDLGLTQFLMLQLTSATQHLHSLGIVYLNWTSGNILSYQSDQGIVVKLCNFSSAACLDGYDVGFLKLALPTNILMPELCNEDKVTLASDVWGLGCILYELVMGHPLWYEHRHASSETLYKMIQEKFSTLSSDPAVNLSSFSPKMSPVVSACWEVDTNKRLSIVDLQLQLIEAFLSGNPSNSATLSGNPSNAAT